VLNVNFDEVLAKPAQFFERRRTVTVQNPSLSWPHNEDGSIWFVELYIVNDYAQVQYFRPLGSDGHENERHVLTG